MSDRMISDLALSSALAARLPSSAPVGLRDRIVAEAQATPQQSRVLSPIAVLFDADPAGRRRALLVLAAMLVAAGLLAAVAAGALRDQHRRELSLDPPPDLAAYLDDTYRGLADLPAFAMVGLEQGAEHRIFSDGRGTIRDESRSVNTTRIVSRARVVELGLDTGGVPTMIDSGPSGSEPGVEIGNYMSLVSSCEAAPEYLGLDLVLGRAAHRIRCDLREYWVDVETRIVLRARAAASTTQSPAETGVGPSPAALADWEVTELGLGPQADRLFSFSQPGYVTVRSDDPACLLLGFGGCTVADGSPQPPQRYVSPAPAPGTLEAPADIPVLLAAIDTAYASVPALEMVIQQGGHVPGKSGFFEPPFRSRHWADGTGQFRTELSDRDQTIYITTGGHIWIRYRLDGRETWADNRGPYADHGGVGDIQLGFHHDCDRGWRAEGVDLVLGRPADRLVCGPETFWIDRETHLVVRSEFRSTDPLQLVTSVAEVVQLHLGEQPADLFDLPRGAVIDPRLPKGGAGDPSPAP